MKVDSNQANEPRPPLVAGTLMHHPIMGICLMTKTGGFVRLEDGQEFAYTADDRYKIFPDAVCVTGKAV